MRLNLVLLSVLLAWRVEGASGDFLSATVETNGWVLDVALSNMGTNGNYNFGLGANNALTGRETVKVTVTSMGFDDTGTAIAVPRTLYGTFALRMPYPSQTNKDQIIVGGVLTNKIVLSDYIFARDSNIVVQMAGAYYTDRTGLTNNSGTLSAANGSVLAYQRPIANWTWPGWDRITGSSYTLRALGFHQSAQQGRPVRLMRFIGQDAHGNRVTNDVLNMTVDRSVGDQLPFGEYIATMPTAGLTQGDLITNTFQAYPWIGDRPLDSGDGTNVEPTPLYTKIFMLNDKTGQYGSTVAVVSPTGTDSTGLAVDSAGFNSNSPPAAFATIAAAASAIAATNTILHARHDVGGGVVYLRSGNYPWLGTFRTYGTLANAYLQVTTFPGDTPAAISSATSGDNTIGGRIKFLNLTISSTSAITFQGETNLWFDACTISTTAPALIYSLVPIWSVTDCNVLSLPQGIEPYSANDCAPALVRGNSTSVAAFGYTVCGNVFNGPLSGTCVQTEASSYSKTIPNGDGSIIYNNIFNRVSAQVGTCYEEYYNSMTNGLAFVQNLAVCSTTGTYQFISICGLTSTNALCNNIIFWHNISVGRSCALAFNNSITGYCQRMFWSLKNNLFDKLDIKTDTGDNPTGTRIGDWSENFGVGYSGNFNANANGIGNTGSINPEFLGLGSFQPAIGGSPAGFFRFNDNEAYNGTTSGTGLGNYQLTPASPVFRLTNEFILPFDLAGNPRQSANVAGVYASPMPLPQFVLPQYLPGGQFQFTISNLVSGATYIVQGSQDLATWTRLATNVPAASTFSFSDPNAGGFGYRFYRVLGPVVP